VRAAIAATAGLAVTAIGVVVAAGMVTNADPDFERGRSPIWTVIVQEAVGAATLVVLALTLRELLGVIRGGSSGRRALMLFPVALGLAAVWWVALLAQRAS
jgi:hypothetical protein